MKRDIRALRRAPETYGKPRWQEVADFALDWASHQELRVVGAQRRIAREVNGRENSRRVA